jgi:hypothetical protein
MKAGIQYWFFSIEILDMNAAIAGYLRWPVPFRAWTQAEFELSKE